MLITDETKDGHLKAAIRNGFKALRGRLRPPEWSAKRRWRVHDDIYFGDSRDSLGIQVADLCNYFLKRKLEGKNNNDQFYKFYARNLICSKAEPEWSQLKGDFFGERRFGDIIRGIMDDERLRRILNDLLQLIVSQDEQIMELSASVTILKLSLIEMRGGAPEPALAEFRELVRKALKKSSISSKQKEIRDLIEHGMDYGKHLA